jgi:hypothetical protein
LRYKNIMQSMSGTSPSTSRGNNKNSRDNVRPVSDNQRVRYSLIHLRRKRQQKASFIGIEHERRRKFNRLFKIQRRKYVAISILMQLALFIFFAALVDYSPLNGDSEVDDSLFGKKNVPVHWNQSSDVTGSHSGEPFLERILGFSSTTPETLTHDDTFTDNSDIRALTRQTEDINEGKQPINNNAPSVLFNLDALFKQIKQENLLIKNVMRKRDARDKSCKF